MKIRKINEKTAKIRHGLLVCAAILATGCFGLTGIAFAEEEEAEAVLPLESVQEEVDASALPGTDELAEGFLLEEAREQIAGGESGEGESGEGESDDVDKTERLRGAAPRADRMNDQEAALYAVLKNEIGRIARGERDDTTVMIPMNAFLKSEYTAAELGVSRIRSNGKITKAAVDAMGRKVKAISYARIGTALLADLPYDFYWFDKVSGYSHGVYGGYVYCHQVHGEDTLSFRGDCGYYYRFYVNKAYSATNRMKTTKTNRALTAATKNAANTAAGVVRSNKGLSDHGKLLAYKNYICSRVSYNTDAARDPSMPYGDPWQLVWVFDKNGGKKVVCEGYSKAFKYLCDLTVFKSCGITCYLVSGPVRFDRGGSGPHMWNVVRMNNGKNYLVDVTNCDEGTPSTGTTALFLRGAPSGTAKAYNVYVPTWRETARYAYDGETIEQFSAAERTLDKVDYDEKSMAAASSAHRFDRGVVTRKATCRSTGVRRHTCHNCGAVLIRTIPRAAHRWGTWKKLNDARHYRVCLHTGHKETAPHKWVRKVDRSRAVDPYFKCNTCGGVKSTVVRDLPAVKIKKVKKGKKSFTVKWKKLSKKTRKKVSYIQVQYSRSKNFTGAGTVTKKVRATKKSVKIKKLKSKKNYYVHIRTYKVIGGKVHVSKWSKTKKVRVR